MESRSNPVFAHFVNENCLDALSGESQEFWDIVEKESSKLEITVDYYLAEFY